MIQSFCTAKTQRNYIIPLPKSQREQNTKIIKTEEKTLTALDSGLCEIGTYANLINVLPPTTDQLVLLTHGNKYVRILTRNTDNTFSLIGKGTSVKLKIFYI